MNKRLKNLSTLLAITVSITSLNLGFEIVNAKPNNSKTKEDLAKVTRNEIIKNEEVSSSKETDNKKIRISVETRKGLFDNKKSLKDKLKKATGGEIKHEFKNIINGFSMEINSNDYEKVKKIAGVKNIKKVKTYKPTMNNANELCEVVNVWKKYNFKGKGLVVSIVDTGIDYNHKDMKLTDPKDGKIKRNEISEKLRGKYFTEKVPYGYNFADENRDVIDKTNSMHGMHVAGIVAANGKEEEIKENKAIRGIAPEAQLLAMKVFSNNPSKYARGASGDDIAAAIDESVNMGADIINLSLGASSGFVDETDIEQKAIENATKKGVIVVAAAGNDGFSSKKNNNDKVEGSVDTELISNPGLDNKAIQVASFENNKTVLPAITYLYNGKTLKIPFMSSEVEPSGVLKEDESFEIVDCGYGRKVNDDSEAKNANDFDGKNLKGKVALIKRGKIDFISKKKNAQNQGAKAVIIYNNDGDNGYMSTAMDPKITIPCIFINNKDGVEILKNLNKDSRVKFTDEVESIENNEKDKMSSFTSWGPTPNLDFKPEISAPGGKIYSTLNNNKYGTKSGTSMATPYTAGSAVLIKENLNNSNIALRNKELSDFIKNTMINTAKILKDGDVPYSPRVQGGGLVQIEQAIKNRVSVTGENGLATIALKEIGKTKEFNLTLTNYGPDDVTYTILGNDVYTEEKNKTHEEKIKDAKIEFSEKEVKVKSHSKTTVKVNLNIPEAFEKNRFVEGFITLESKTKEVPSLSIPYMGFYGEWQVPENIDKPLWEEYKFNGSCVASKVFSNNVILGLDRINSTESKLVVNQENIGFSPNNDGVYDSIMPNLCIFRNLKNIKVDILDKDKNIIRSVGNKSDVSKTSVHNLRTLLNSLEWDGQTYVPESGKKITAPDGEYYMKITSESVSDGNKTQSFEMPIKLDTEKPKIEVLSDNSSKGGKYILKWKASDKGVGLRVDSKGLKNGDPYVFVDGKKIENTTIKEENGVFSAELNLEKGNRNVILVVNDEILNQEVIQKEVLVGDEIVKTIDVALNLKDNLEINNTMVNDKKEYLLKGKVSKKVTKLLVNDKNVEIKKNENSFENKISLRDGKNLINIKAYNEKNEEIFNSNFSVIGHLIMPNLEISTNPNMEKSKDDKVFGVVNTDKDKFKLIVKINPNENNAKLIINNSEIKKEELKNGTLNKELSLKQGINIIEVIAKDKFGSENKKNIKVVADYKNEKFNFNFKFFNNTTKSFETLNPQASFGKDEKDITLYIQGNQAMKVVKINGKEMNKENLMEYSKTIRLHEGVNKLLLYIEDKDGNVVVNYATTVYSDNKSPIIRIINPFDFNGKFYTNKNIIRLKGDVADDVLGYRFYINGDQVLNVEKGENFGIEESRRKFLKDIKVFNGDKIELLAKDEFGNETKMIYDVIVFDEKPEIVVKGLENNKDYKNKVLPNITSNREGDSIEAYLDGSKESYKGEAITEKGSHNLVIKAKDLAGNETKKSISFKIK